jgi:hypothetical protein
MICDTANASLSAKSKKTSTQKRDQCNRNETAAIRGTYCTEQVLDDERRREHKLVHDASANFVVNLFSLEPE